MTRPELSRGPRTIVTSGNFLQFFDWTVYSLMAPVFAREFFHGDRAGASIGVFLVYGASVLLCPIGSALGGLAADRYGRKKAMVASMAVSGIASIAMGVLPGTDRVGLLAPVLLALARGVQAIAFGAEWPVAVTYLMEMAPRRQRLRYGADFVFTCTAGGFAASGVGALLSWTLGPHALDAIGWRVPFLVAGVLSLVLCRLRRRLRESVSFAGLRTVAAEQVPAERAPSHFVRAHWRAMLVVAALAASATSATTTFSVVVPAVAQARLGASPSTVLGANTLVTGALLVLIPLLGHGAERIGLRRLLSVVSLGLLVALPALYLTLSPSYGGLVLAGGVGMLLCSALGLALPQAMTSLFPVGQRGLGVGISQGVANAVFGAFAPAAALALDAGRAWCFALSVCLLVLIGWAATAAGLRRAEGTLPPAESTDHVEASASW